MIKISRWSKNLQQPNQKDGATCSIKTISLIQYGIWFLHILSLTFEIAHLANLCAASFATRLVKMHFHLDKNCKIYRVSSIRCPN
jgi:hypothetical protein